jgi:hypothetical protein
VFQILAGNSLIVTVKYEVDYFLICLFKKGLFKFEKRVLFSFETSKAKPDDVGVIWRSIISGKVRVDY